MYGRHKIRLSTHDIRTSPTLKTSVGTPPEEGREPRAVSKYPPPCHH